MRIIILEDNADRRQAMSIVIAEFCPHIVTEYFVTSAQIIERLKETGLDDVAFIALDNDLDMLEGDDGRLVDAGDGVEVARWLSQQPPVVPVIIHTTNRPAGDQIEELLGTRGWTIDRVVPYEGERWIREVWRTSVRAMLRNRSKK